MAQFRLTHKFASDLKVSLKGFPKPQIHPLDDWICDVFRVNRKKVALLTHAETLISFLVPYREVGGANNVLDFLPVELESYLRYLDLENWVPSMLKIFEKPPVFTKTKNKKVLGHMNDFKAHVLCCFYRSEEDLNWHKVTKLLKEIPMNSNNFKNSEEILIEYLNNKNHSNIKFLTADYE